MSVRIMSAIFETGFIDLVDGEGNVTKASTAKLIMLALADHANDEGESAYPSVGRLAKKTSLSEQTVRNTLDALKYNGVVYLDGTSKHMTNSYIINKGAFPKLNGQNEDFLPLNRLDPSNRSLAPLQPVTNTPQPVRPESSLTPNKTSNMDEIKESANREVDAIIGLARQNSPMDEACKAFEGAFKVGAWPWSSNSAWTKFAKFVLTEYEKDPSCFSRYVAWRAKDGKYQGMTNNRIRQNPESFIDTGWPTFLAHSSMYGQKEVEYL